MQLIPRVVVVVVLTLSLTFSTLSQIRTDTGAHPESPKSVQLSPAGGKYVDDLSGISVMRLTDERDGRSFSTTYPVWNAFNRDTTRVWLFEHGGPYYVAKIDPNTLTRVGPLEAVEPDRGSFVDYESANWSGLDNDKTFIASDCKIKSYRPSTKQYTLVADLTSFFPAGARFNQLYVSRDDNRFAAVVRSGASGSGDHGIMVYELSSNTVKLNASFTDINGISMDKSGRFVLLVRNDPEGQVKQRIFNVDTGAVEILTSDANGKPDYAIGHNDTGVDFIIGGDQWRGAFTARKMSAPHDVTLAWQYASLGGWINWHVSTRADNEYWALVSTYGGYLTVVNGNTVVLPDGPFVREIFQVGVKEPFIGRFRRLVHTRANWTPQVYWDTPRAAISPDGRCFAWTSNNNAPSGSRTDVFVACMEPAPLPGATPAPSMSPTPTPQPSSVPTPVPSPTVIPTPTPAPSPSLQPTPAPTIAPNPSPTPTPVPGNKRCKAWPPWKLLNCL